jgi:hypothetical protein
MTRSSQGLRSMIRSQKNYPIELSSSANCFQQNRSFSLNMPQKKTGRSLIMFPCAEFIIKMDNFANYSTLQLGLFTATLLLT